MRILGLGVVLLLWLCASACGEKDDGDSGKAAGGTEPELVGFEQITRAEAGDRSPGAVRQIPGAAAGKQRLEGVVTGCQENQPPALVREGEAWRLEYLPGARSGVNCLVAEYYLVSYDVLAETVTPG